MDTPAPHTPPPRASLDASEKFRYAVQYAILAPSSHNSQPWRFMAEGEDLLICADRTRALSVVDPHDRELVISCGAALFNLRVALAHIGCATEITTLPYSADPDVLARVEIARGRIPDATLAALFDAIPSRATDRRAFADKPVADEVCKAIVDAAAAEGVTATLAIDLERRRAVAELIADADRQQFADPRFRRELASWIHGSREADGMSAYALGVPALLDFATPVTGLVVRTFDMGGGVAASHLALVRGSPLFVCLSTPTDDAFAWLLTGQALERILLTLAASGYAASFLNQPLEIESLRTAVREEMGGAARPQLLLRVGESQAPVLSRRRPVSEVLIE